MHDSSRRNFLGKGLATVAVATGSNLHPNVLLAAKPHVVVIGGGAGGATAARLIAQNSRDQIDVTLVEPNKTYHSCFFSNIYLGGFRPYESLSHDYSTLRSQYGIEIVHDKAVDIDRQNRSVKLSNGSLQYDILILAPGIDFVEGSVTGWSLSAEQRMPHAYKGGEQVRLLRSQIEAMREGGVFAIVAPSGSYRCPPGPYERVCMAAHRLKLSNPTAKIIIVDPKPVFSKMGLFREAWKKHYKGMIDMNSDVDMKEFSVDPDAMSITLAGEQIKVDVCNVIPNQKAGTIAELAGVVENGWAPVRAQDMRSRIDDHIYVLGDAAEQGDMPKSGFSANSQAKVCVNAILSKLIGSESFEARYSNTCWSLLSENNGVKIGATYEASPVKIEKIKGFSSKRREDDSVRKRTYQESIDWYSSITIDMFG